jgi:hypothetical protein
LFELRHRAKGVSVTLRDKHFLERVQQDLETYGGPLTKELMLEAEKTWTTELTKSK